MHHNTITPFNKHKINIASLIITQEAHWPHCSSEQCFLYFFKKINMKLFLNVVKLKKKSHLFIQIINTYM